MDIDPFPLRPAEQPAPSAAPPLQKKGMPRHQLPLCPGCSRPVDWEVFACPHCGHLFDPTDGRSRHGLPVRHDGENHRGGLIDTLGTVCLLAGVIALCTGPIGFLVALLTGVPTLVMAGHDLPRMTTGIVDPEGRSSTLAGQRKAIVGVVLGLLFGLFSLLFYLGMMFE